MIMDWIPGNLTIVSIHAKPQNRCLSHPPKIGMLLEGYVALAMYDNQRASNTAQTNFIREASHA